MRFEFELARELGMTHANLVRSMSGSEFAHWIALYQIEHRERERAQKRSEAKARARRMSRGG